MRDSVDALVASWHEREPGLDFSPVEVVNRLQRLRGRLDPELQRVFAAHGLSAANFAVLVTLARIGGASQRRLLDELGLTSGTMSVRMDRLVEAGLVDRGEDPESRRNNLITLTPRGQELYARAVPAHLANERRLLAALDDEERETLAALLRKLLLEFEGSAAPPRLGLTLAPAHVTIELRESVGLPPVAGLLVRAVADDGPAARAGIRTGDVLLVRSVTDLHARLDDADGPLKLRLLRGDEERAVTLTPAAGGAPGPRRAGEHVV
jgi:DNA-binding MarR family transcriptional regulator